MARAVIEAQFPCPAERVWAIVTDLENWRWRSDLQGLEVKSETTFIEYDKSGIATTFTVTASEPCRRYAFSLENRNLTGQWEGLFRETAEGTVITFTEEVHPRSPLLRLLAGAYLRKQQQQYLADLRRALEV